MTFSLFRGNSASESKKPLENNGKSKDSGKNCTKIAMQKSDKSVLRPRKNQTLWTNSNRQDNEKYVNSGPFYRQDFLSVRPPGLKILHGEGSFFKEKRGKRETTKAIRKYIQDYCGGTSLHGLKYVGAEDVSLCERIFWILAFATAMAFSVYFINNIYEKWTFTPVIVGINPQFKSVKEIPFPAVTICNMNQAMKKVAQPIVKGKNQVDKLMLEDICDIYGNTTDNTFTGINPNLTNWNFIKKFLIKISQPCSELLVNCKWEGNTVPCTSILNSALTDEGVCCTFNRVADEYMFHDAWTLGDFDQTIPSNNIPWTPENGYPPDANATTWPYRAGGSGEHIGLSIVVNINAKEYYCSSTSSVGLKIRLHSPVESPMMADYGFFVHPRKEVRIAIRPTMDEASATINSIPIYKRQCYFSDERDLHFYKTYTKLNCELECLSNYTLSSCECVPYYLPKNLNTAICDKSKDPCHTQAKADMDLILLPSIYCKCLPACNEITYAQDHSLGDISRSDILQPEARNISLTDLIILHFFYPTTRFRSFQKSELFGFTEFVSNSGGLLGLFLGFSVLSAVEILYHLTLRLWCLHYRQNKTRVKKTMIYPFTQ